MTFGKFKIYKAQEEILKDPIIRKIEYFISEKIKDPDVVYYFLKDKDVRNEIREKQKSLREFLRELEEETTSSEAERIAEEIIEKFKDKIRKIERKLKEVV